MKPPLYPLTLFLALVTLFPACKTDSKDSAQEKETPVSVTLAEGTLEVDTAASELQWTGTMIGLYEHSGTVDLNLGYIIIENGAIAGGRFEADLKSIKPSDSNYTPEEERTPEKLVKHLSSDDFFHVAEYPVATFEITGSEGNTVMGNLTIRDKTFPEKVQDVVVLEEEGGLTFTGQLIFDRTKYDVAFKHPMQEMVLSNDVKMDIKLVAEQ